MLFDDDWSLGQQRYAQVPSQHNNVKLNATSVNHDRYRIHLTLSSSAQATMKLLSKLTEVNY